MNINLLNKISEQVQACYNKYGAYASGHEAMGVLFEEIDELWAEVKQKEHNNERIGAEIVDCIVVLVKMYKDIVENDIKR